MRILKSSYVHKDPYRYHMQPELYSALTQDKVIREAALRSGVSQDVMQELKDTAIQITCYDRNGDIVRRATFDERRCRHRARRGLNRRQRE